MTAVATLLAEVDFGPRAFAIRLPQIGWLVTDETGALRVVDEHLSELARFARRSAWRGHAWVTTGLERVVLSERDRVSMIDADGREVWTTTHHPWGDGGSESGSCWISPDARIVWATVPAADGPDEWWVLDAGTGRVLAKAHLNCRAAGSHSIPHPDGIHVGLSVGEGQDGVEIYWGRWDGEPHVTRVDARDRVLVAARPNGRDYLATPHGVGANALTVHAFPGGEVRARLSPEGLVGADDWFDFEAGYVTNDVVLASSVVGQRHFALAADTLAVIDEVAYPRNATAGGISPTGRGTWLTSDYLAGRYQLWQGPWR